MARSEFRLNHGGMAALLKSSEVRAALQGPAQAILSRAQAGAPRDTGELAASGHLEDATTDRAVVRVVFDSDHALVQEARAGFLSRAIG